MASKGPAPRPERLRVLAGLPPTPRGPVAAAVVVEAPASLSPAARVVWDRLAPDLIRRAVLDAWSVDAFARYCWCQATSTALRAALDAEGYLVAGRHEDEPVKSKYWPLIRQTDAELLALEARFGLLPADRARVAALDEPSDPLGAERLLSPERLFT